MKRRVLNIEAGTQVWWLETLQVEMLEQDLREDYFVLSGEALCQYLLRRDGQALIIARGPAPFISGNKASVGYISPLTGLPHYSFVGGRAASQLLDLGVDAICFGGGAGSGALEGSDPPRQSAGPDSAGTGNGRPVMPMVLVSGRAPNLRLVFEPADALPTGQRSAYYWLLETALGGEAHAGSIFTLGEGARFGYRAANLAVEAIYHAGRGGAGHVFARHASALVLRGEPMTPAGFFPGDESPFARNPNRMIEPLVEKHCARLSGRTGGTIAKLFTTGADPAGRNTLPASNARQLGYELADLGSPKVLRATRAGKTGCHWCQVDCRHYHWVPADYAPEGRDAFLDDFEPTYALFAMLGLAPAEDTLQARLDLLGDVTQRLILPIEQMGCDVLNVGTALAALLEGLGRGVIPPGDVPDSLTRTTGSGGRATSAGQRLEAAVDAVALLRSGQALAFPALRAAGDGPQALAELYPPMQDIVFTSGKGTLGNAGHCNNLWTFLMPFSRFFSHYSGQIYKIDEQLPPSGAGAAAYRASFERVVQRMLQREFFWVLCNALSMCAFTFVIFSQDGQGERLSEDDLLVRLLRQYGIRTTRDDLEWFAQAFWAQSIDLKGRFGWRPPSAGDLPRRVYEALALALERPVEELQALMALLIEEWKRQAGEVMGRFGYEMALE